MKKTILWRWKNKPFTPFQEGFINKQTEEMIKIASTLYSTGEWMLLSEMEIKDEQA